MREDIDTKGDSREQPSDQLETAAVGFVRHLIEADGTNPMGGDSFGRGINYMQGHTTAGNTINESLSVEADDQPFT